MKTYDLSGTYIVRLIARRGMWADTAYDTLQLFPPAQCMVRIHTPMGNLFVELTDETAAEIHPQLIHLRGALGAARLSDRINPQRASSPTQFYIVHGHRVTDDLLDRIEAENGILYTDQQRQLYLRYGGTPELDGKYTVFGYVRRGFEVIDSIAAVPRDDQDRPLRNIPMQITLIR